MRHSSVSKWLRHHAASLPKLPSLPAVPNRILHYGVVIVPCYALILLHYSAIPISAIRTWSLFRPIPSRYDPNHTVTSLHPIAFVSIVPILPVLVGILHWYVPFSIDGLFECVVVRRRPIEWITLGYDHSWSSDPASTVPTFRSNGQFHCPAQHPDVHVPAVL